VQESLFIIMEDGILQDGTLSLDMPPMTFIGATTDPTRLLTPMLDRFPRKLKLVPYSPDELAVIVEIAARKLGDEMSIEGANAIGNRAEGVPRVALNMMLAARDYAYAASGRGGKVTIGLAAVQQALASPAYDWRVTGRNASSR
jgi:Holliday junction resolvasome RuvABC ATP-dependent DNA helicase subunit